METDSFAQTEKHIIPGRTKGDSFSVTQYGLLGSRSPLLLGIAVRNCEGVVIGVLTATRMPDEDTPEEDLKFGNEDCLVMHLMAQYTAGNIEKIAAKKVLSAASNNIVACENTLKVAIGKSYSPQIGFRSSKENSRMYF